MSETRARTIKGVVGSVVKTSETGSAAISTSFTAPRAARLISVTCAFDAAPTTSENLTVTYNAQAGAEYDVLLYCIDPAAMSAVSIIAGTDDWGKICLVDGDQIDIAYPNTDGNTYGVEISIEELI